MKKTNRGFKIFSRFKDTYKTEVIVQESSSVAKRCWIFCSNDGKNPSSNLKTDGAIHLNVGQAKLIINALQKFINS